MSKENQKRLHRKAQDVRKTEMEDMSKNADGNAREWMKRRPYPGSRLSPMAKALIRTQGEQILKRGENASGKNTYERN